MPTTTGRYRLAFRAGYHQDYNHTLTRTMFVSDNEFPTLAEAVFAVRSAIHHDNLHPGIQEWIEDRWRDMGLLEWRDLATANPDPDRRFR